MWLFGNIAFVDFSFNNVVCTDNIVPTKYSQWEMSGFCDIFLLHHGTHPYECLEEFCEENFCTNITFVFHLVLTMKFGDFVEIIQSDLIETLLEVGWPTIKLTCLKSVEHESTILNSFKEDQNWKNYMSTLDAEDVI